jgi:hypothetical protein
MDDPRHLGRAPGQQIQDVGAQRLLALPVVEQTAVSGFSPLGGSSRRLGLDGGRVSAYVKAVSTGYFATLGVPIEEGRTFSAARRSTRLGPAAVLRQE